MQQNIVIAIDYSSQGEQAVRFYVERMHRADNSVILVHSVDLPELSITRARDRNVSPAVLADMWKEEESKLKLLEAKMTYLLRMNKIPAVLRIVLGRPDDAICRIADEESAAMIIIGSRGVNKVWRSLVGSVADSVIQRASCPVVICCHRNHIDRLKGRQSSFGNETEVRKVRHSSGESIASRIRHRFASGSHCISQASRCSGSDHLRLSEWENGDPDETRIE